MFNNLIGKNKELGRFLFCERYTLPPVKNAMFIAEGQELKRGAVVDVNGVLVGTNSLMPYAVLEFDCDTRSGGKEASVFIKGEFNFDKLHFAEGLEKSDLDNIVYNGSGIGIVIKPYEYAEGFSPLMVPAGTSKSNPLMTAEETERMIDAMKPIDAMTLRFEFSKKDYNPETAGVGSAGTWTKVDSPTLNVWDWTNEATDWSEAFKGAFPDTDNEVSVIAAGDTSSVTSIQRLFAGVFSGNIGSNTYSLITRNNLISCVPLDISSCSDAHFMFAASSIREYVQFDYTGNTTIQISAMFYDTLIEEIGNIHLSGSTLASIFGHCSKLKRVGNIECYVPDYTSQFQIFANTSNFEAPLEEVGNISITGGSPTDYSTMFQSCVHLKRVGSIDCTSGTTFTNLFSQCHELEAIPKLIGIGSSNIVNVQGMFNGCYLIREVPTFDTSHVTNARAFINTCISLIEIPDYDFSAVTDVRQFAKNCYKMKSGILETYDKFLARGAAITAHTDAFIDCGRDTTQGRAALEQIPQSWGGLAEG